jgi:hypothetical protein
MTGDTCHRVHDAVSQPILADLGGAQARIARNDHHHRLPAFLNVQLVRVRHRYPFEDRLLT